MTVNTPVRARSTDRAVQSPAQLFMKFRFIFAPIICIGLVLLVWQLLFNAPEAKMPTPVEVISYLMKSFGELMNPMTDGSIAKNILISLQRVAVGYSLAAIAGIVAGVLIGVSPFLRSGFDPMVQVLRTIPPLAWLPLSLAMFQNNNLAGLFLIFITSIWPILINTAVGVQQIPKDYTNVSRVLRLSGPEYVTSILIPSTVPYIFTGLRIGIGLAWLAIVAAEMLKSDGGGIGFYIWDAYNAGNDDGMAQIILAVLFVGLVGLGLDRLVGFVGSKIVSEE